MVVCVHKALISSVFSPLDVFSVGKDNRYMIKKG